MGESMRNGDAAGDGWSGTPRAGSFAHRMILGIGLLVVTALVHAAGSAIASEAYVFSVRLEGEPEAGCVVTTPDGACNGDRIRGAVIADGAPALNGKFSFAPPGVRDDRRQPLGRVGRGHMTVTFMPASDGASRRCVLRGRVGIHGVALPGGTGTRRFYTGTFDGRGKCGEQRARMRAIWSGGIGAEPGPIVFDFERFQGRMAGTLWYPGRTHR